MDETTVHFTLQEIERNRPLGFMSCDVSELVWDFETNETKEETK